MHYNTVSAVWRTNKEEYDIVYRVNFFLHWTLNTEISIQVKILIYIFNIQQIITMYILQCVKKIYHPQQRISSLTYSYLYKEEENEKTYNFTLQKQGILVFSLQKATGYCI